MFIKLQTKGRVADASENRGVSFIIITSRWDLFIKNTLGPANLSTVVHSSEVKNVHISTIGKSIFGALEGVLCMEVISMVFFIGSVL